MTRATTLQFRPSLSLICNAVIEAWPEHDTFLSMRFAESTDPSLQIAEEMADLVLRIVGNDLPQFINGYRWMCEAFVAEDLYFRRTGSYRLNSFEDAYSEVYSRDDYMQKYLRGILLSQVLWANQTASFYFYIERFLARLKVGADYLEIGPGHGLLLFFAARSQMIGSITGWDVSESSLAMTRSTLEAVGLKRPFNLKLQNILDSPSVSKQYDAVVVSEVLEHLDRPQAALDTVFHALRPGGLAFFNVPVNSPAPDHIYYWGAPDEVEEMVRSVGFSILDSLDSQKASQ